VIVRARGRDPETRKTYEGEMHVDFVDADEIAWLRHPLAAPGASDAILVDSQFEWCLEVRGSSTEGKRVKLLASPRIEVSPELAVDQSPSEWRPSRAGCHRVNARRPGPALIGASFGAVERSVPLEIVTSEAVVGATIRRFSDARALPPWLPVEENLVDGFSEPLSGLDLLVGASRELYVLTLELEGGMTSHAGVGALTVGPSGVARLVDVVVDTRGETPAILFDPTTLDSSAPLVTRSLFSVVPVAPGRAELEFALGSAKLNLPIEVTAAAGTGGTGSGTGGSAGRAGEGGSGGDAGAPDGGAPEAGAGGDAESAGNGGSEGGAAGR
jgi:hypothetical protein